MGILFTTERSMRCQAMLARDLAASATDPRRRRQQLQLASWLERQLRDSSELYLL